MNRDRIIHLILRYKLENYQTCSHQAVIWLERVHHDCSMLKTNEADG